jgi:phosphomannomutase
MNIDPSIFKAYDIRGVYPETINAEVAYKIAQAYVKFLNPKTVVVGKDVRLSGPEILAAVKQGLIDHGVKVIDIGMVTTDMMYFGVVHTGADGGLMVTASHNPKEYNGMKLVKAKAGPISGDSGMYDIRDIAVSDYKYAAEQLGEAEELDIFEPYLEKVLSTIDIGKIKPCKIVANLNFGAIGRNVKAVAEKLNLEMIWLNEQPNGEFPKGRPDPLIPANREETIALIKSSGADLGVAWDADADRCFFFDETGRFLSGYFTTSILAEYLIKRYGPSEILVDSKLNWATEELVKSLGGTTAVTKTGHSFYKEKMIQDQAVFGGEVSAHYFFKEFYFLDNGLIPFLLILEMYSQSGKKMSEIYQPLFDKYFAIEETNFKVKSVAEAVAAFKARYADGKISELDGVAVEYPEWRFSVRGSNTEPIIRLNMEARSRAEMESREAELVEFMKPFLS